MPLTITFQLTDRDLTHLGQVVNQAKANASALDEADIIRAAKASLKEASQVDIADFIRQRLDKLALLVQMLEDKVWELSREDRVRITNALAYFSDPNDIIPDNVPGFGFLDDAIVIDLACLELRHDIEAYQDFCRFREAEVKRRGKSVDPTSPDQWLRTRRAQLQDRMGRRRATLWESRLGRRSFF